MDIYGLKHLCFICLIIATSGLFISATPFGRTLEENFGLAFLFNLRGTRSAPEQPLIIAIDRQSATYFGLQQQPYKWPRTIHAEAVRTLTELGVSAIGFDLYFEESRSPQDDLQFAQAMTDAGNVVILQRLKKSDIHHDKPSKFILEQRIPALEIFENAAAVLSPFPLPRYPVRLNQAWLFKEGAYPIATLPVALFAIYRPELFQHFLELVKQETHPQTLKKNTISSFPPKTSRLDSLFTELRTTLATNPALTKRVRSQILKVKATTPENRKSQNYLISLLNIFSGKQSRFINYYGPPGTITTRPYHTLFDSSYPRKNETLTAKAVFIGLNHESDIGEKDGFYTVFTNSGGKHISGVEIAATIFANLIDRSFISPTSTAITIALLFIASMGAGISSHLFSPVPAGLICLGISIMYISVAYLVFIYKFTWLPLVTPVLIQIPVTHLTISLFKHRKLVKNKKNIQAALHCYIPENLATELELDQTKIGQKHEEVRGICLYSDLENYTILSEKANHKQLTQLINNYYKDIFQLIKLYSGTVLDIRGDSMLALWPNSADDSKAVHQSCCAALAISEMVNSKQPQHTFHLPTRIGLHQGNLSVGNIGALDHYQYTITGDTVNTVARIESLNKQIGTRLLVSETIASNCDAMAYRKMGSFLFVGKNTPVTIYEILGKKQTLLKTHINLKRYFAKGQKYFQEGDFIESKKQFEKCQTICPNDGPSKWFIQLCKGYSETNPPKNWNGVIRLSKK